MPADSNLYKRLDPAWEWGHTQELLGLIAQLIDQGNRLFFDRYRSKGSPRATPIQITRPGTERQLEKPRIASAEEVERFFLGGRN